MAIRLTKSGQCCWRVFCEFARRCNVLTGVGTSPSGVHVVGVRAGVHGARARPREAQDVPRTEAQTHGLHQAPAEGQEE